MPKGPHVTASNERILVMGVGNPLMRDDGAGPRVIEVLLDGFIFPDNVEVVDAGTMGYSILDMFREIDQLIVVDAIKSSGHDPGTVLVLTPEDMADNEIIRSAHDTRLIDVLRAAALLGYMPKTVAVGIQIESIAEWVLELSEPVAAAVPIATAAVLDQLRNIGVEPTVREGSHPDARILEALRTHAPMSEGDAEPVE